MADGKEIILKGAVANHLVYDNPVSVFQRDVDWMSEHGANFVELHWNSGFLDRAGYVSKLVQCVEYARGKGMRVALALHSRGLKPGSTWEPQQITVADDSIIEDWRMLLSDPSTAQTLGASVDIFCPIAELEKNLHGSYVSWAETKALEEQTVLLIRQKTGNSDAIGALTGPGFAGDPRGALTAPPQIENVAVEVHPYLWTSSWVDFKSVALALREKGILVYIGEMGHDDPMSYTEDLYKFVTEHNISFAVYAINSASDYPTVLYAKGGIVTPSGKKAVEYWNVGR